IPPPICPGHGLQLEWPDTVCRLDMRSSAEIEEIALLIGRDLLPVSKAVDELDLVRIVPEEIERLLTRNDRPHEGFGRVLMGAHSLFDRGEIVRTQRLREVHVVVEAVLDRRTD